VNPRGADTLEIVLAGTMAALFIIALIALFS
jgi:hypothetical protein